MRSSSREWWSMKKTVGCVLSAALLGVTGLLTGCASSPETTLEVTWAAPQLPPAKSFGKLLIITVAPSEFVQEMSFGKLLIITVAPSEFVQEAFQNQMAAELKKRGVNAVASRRYFTRYTDAERDRFMRSIADSDADHILLARVTDTTTKTYEGGGTIIGPGGVPYGDAVGVQGAYDRAFYPGAVVSGGAGGVVKTATSEASIFAAKGDEPRWSARIRTPNAQSETGARYAPEYVGVVLEAMKKDKLL